MKKAIRLSLLLAIAFCIALVNPLTAQNINNDMNALAKKYESAYNRKDVKTLKGMYVKDAMRTNPDGITTTGIDAITDSMAEDFRKYKVVMIKIRSDKSVKESDGSVTATGTYHVMGTTKKGKKIYFKGAYTNTVVKDGGKWKIEKMILKAI